MNKTIIIFGTGRSGTTVISNIICNHIKIAFPSQYQNRFPKWLSINRLRYLFDTRLFRSIFGALVGDKILDRIIFNPVEAYDMWEYLTDKGTDFSRDFLLDREVSKKEKSFIIKYFSKLVRKQNKEHLVFKITGPSRLKYLLSIFPEAYYIHVTRDPIPTISSFLKVDFWKSRGARKLWWLGAYSNEELDRISKFQSDPLAMTSFQIKKLIDTTKIEIEQNKLKYINIEYEKFIAKPKETINKIFEFIDLRCDEACLSYLNELRIKNTDRVHTDYFSTPELDRIDTILSK